MKRHPSLAALSREHHPALVLARRARGPAGAAPSFVAELLARFAAELAPHFRAEEGGLLVALRAAGEAALTERTLAEHRRLEHLVQRIGAGAGGCVPAFGELLAAHVRFEEQELFPRAEALLDEGALARLHSR